ncbi:MAG: HNH endonuclease [Myxococcales bacterium]|nr:HNH endonuclease [Myxococcales bacterium]
MLAILNLLDEGVIDPEQVRLDDRLVEEVDEILRRASIERSAIAWQPFFHLGTTKGTRDPIWTLVDKAGQPLRLVSADAPSSIKATRDNFAYASFSRDLIGALRTERGRTAVRQLIFEWLEQRPDPDARRVLEAHDPDWTDVDRYRRDLRARSSQDFSPFAVRPRIELSAKTRRVRSRAFRLEVLEQYDDRCAACGLRLRLGAMVEAEASHIIPVMADGVDDVRNGLALCRTHHWAFDAKLWTVNSESRILVARDADERSDLAALRRDLADQQLRPPVTPAFAPHPDALDWHRKHWFVDAPAA